MTSSLIKAKARELGADLCGIASVDRFAGIPAISNPLSIMPEAKSVIVVAVRFLSGTLGVNSSIPYTIVRNVLSRRIDEMTVRLAEYIEDGGYRALPVGAIEPCNYDRESSRKVGLLSLKYAASRAGLGVIGKNTLLLTPEYGNMVWLGAVISSVDAEADEILTSSPCVDKCRICIDECPVGAIDGGLFMDQEKCRQYAFGEEGGGEWRIKCNRCRAKCPHALGYDAHGG